MPVRYRIEAGGAYVTACYEGQVDLADVVRVYSEYRNDPAFLPSRPHLVDLSALRGSSAGFSEIRDALSMFERTQAQMNAPLRISVFAPTDLGFGLSRMFETMASMSAFVDARVFDNRDDARNWLSEQLHHDPDLR